MMGIMHCRTVCTSLPTGIKVHLNKGMYQLVIVECVLKFQGSPNSTWQKPVDGYIDSHVCAVCIVIVSVR